MLTAKRTIQYIRPDGVAQYEEPSEGPWLKGWQKLWRLEVWFGTHVVVSDHLEPLGAKHVWDKDFDEGLKHEQIEDIKRKVGKQIYLQL